MIQDLLSFLDSSPVNFLAVDTICKRLDQAGFRRIDATMPLKDVKPGSQFYVTKNDSSVYAFRIGSSSLADNGFHIICAHCDSPTFRIKPNAEITCEGGITKLNTEVYGGPIMSTWFDRPLSLAGRVIVKGTDAMNPQTKLLFCKKALMQISNLAIHFNRQVNDGVKLSKQKDMLPIIGIVQDELEKGNMLLNLICEEVGCKPGDVLDFDLYLMMRPPPVPSVSITSLSPADVLMTSVWFMPVFRPCCCQATMYLRPHRYWPSLTTRRPVARPSREPAARSWPASCKG